jgi:hypothetical protein
MPSYSSDQKVQFSDWLSSLCKSSFPGIQEGRKSRPSWQPLALLGPSNTQVQTHGDADKPEPMTATGTETGRSVSGKQTGQGQGGDHPGGQAARVRKVVPSASKRNRSVNLGLVGHVPSILSSPAQNSENSWRSSGNQILRPELSDCCSPAV